MDLQGPFLTSDIAMTGESPCFVAFHRTRRSGWEISSQIRENVR